MRGIEEGETRRIAEGWRKDGTYSADNLARVVDNGDRLLHGGRARGQFDEGVSSQLVISDGLLDGEERRRKRGRS